MSENTQTIQWFPGHMAKTKRKIKEIIPIIDAVAEVVDAIIPLSSRNPDLKEIIENIGVEFRFSDFTEKLNGKSLTHVFNVVDPFSVYGDKANEEIAKFFKERIQ